MKAVETVIFDLDNTLYDWYAAFLPAFYAMVDSAVGLLHCDREQLLDQLKSVHVKHHDVEHPFAIFETQIVQALAQEHGDEYVSELLDPALHSYNSHRKRHLKLFDGARDTLEELHRQSVRLIAFTDSKYYSALGRLERLGLGNWFERVYCRRRGASSARSKAMLPREFADRVRELPPHEAKPDPIVLRDIVDRERTTMRLTAYVGDSMAKDVLMAKQAGCFAIWAKYGAASDPTMYAKLVRISHWTDEDIAREKHYSTQAKAVSPDFVCERSITEMLAAVQGPVHSALS